VAKPCVTVYVFVDFARAEFEASKLTAKLLAAL
jgi:hypothetical protein